MIALWMVAAVVGEVLVGLSVGRLFAPRRESFDVHADQALAVVAEPSDDFEQWAAELRRHDVYGGDE